MKKILSLLALVACFCLPGYAQSVLGDLEGNIYTISGQLVGKGNLNSLRHMQKGVYVVNGVKVIKK